MTYAPIDPTALVPRLAGNSGLLDSIATNGDEVYATYAPTVIDLSRSVTVGTSATSQRVFAWTLRGNRDLLTVRTRVYASGTGGSSTLKVYVGGASGTATVSGAAAWYTVDVVPATSGPIHCEIQVTTGGGITATVDQAQCYLVAAAPGSGRLASGYIKSGAGLFAGDEPICSEHMERLTYQPVYVARDRPVCVAQHVTELTTSGAKDVGNWNSYDLAVWDPIGLSKVPAVDARTRSYWVDAFTRESGSGARGLITIGTATVYLPSFGGTTGQWTRQRITLGAGEHEVRASILPGAGNSARIATCQIWRGVILGS